MDRNALPAGELLHPLPLLAVILLALNDHVFKGSGLLPAWLTGKLSDFTGLFFFPLLLTAVGNSLALGLRRTTGWDLDPSLRRWKLVAATLVTGLAFAALKTWPAWERIYLGFLGAIGFPSRNVRDPWDLLALGVLPFAYWLGMAQIRRIPLGRLELIRGRGPSRVAYELRDVRALGDAAAVDAFSAPFAKMLAEPSDPDARSLARAALTSLRR